MVSEGSPLTGTSSILFPFIAIIFNYGLLLNVSLPSYSGYSAT